MFSTEESHVLFQTVACFTLELKVKGFILNVAYLLKQNWLEFKTLVSKMLIAPISAIKSPEIDVTHIPAFIILYITYLTNV